MLTPAEQDSLKAQAEADGAEARVGGVARRQLDGRTDATPDGSSHRERRPRPSPTTPTSSTTSPRGWSTASSTGTPVEQAVDLARIEKAVREILIAVGEDPDRDGLRAHAGPGRPGVRRAVRRPAGRPGAGPHHHLRGQPRRAGAGPRHRGDVALRAPPAAVPRAWRTSATSPASTGGSPACPSWPGWSRSTPGGRRCRSGSPRRSPTC